MIANAQLEALAGVAALGLAAVLLHDAYERRAQKQPLWLRPLTFW